MAQKFSDGDLIPGLPNEVSELCLLRLPFPYPALLRPVSSTWNRILSNPSFFVTKSRLSLTKPYLFALVRDQISKKIQWRCLDPVSKNWCPLPPMPISDAELREPASMASSVAEEKGEMCFYRRGWKHYVMVYSVATNSWRIWKDSIKHGGSFFTSAATGGKAFAFSDGDDSLIRVRCYDPVLNSLVYTESTTGRTASHYDASVIGKKIYVTEFPCPFEVKLVGSVYDTELNTWDSIPVGMWEGWTGSAAKLGSNLFMLNATNNREVKVYNHVTDSWMQVKGSGIPKLLKMPYAFAADVENGKLYVVGRGLDVAIATLIEVERKKWEVEWDVVKGSDAFSHFFPCNCQIVYA